MGTKSVTLVPDAYSRSYSPVSDSDWKSYDGTDIRSDTGTLWFRFPASLINSINGTINVSGAIVSGEYDLLDRIDYYYSPTRTVDRLYKIGTLSVYPFSGSHTANFSTGDRNVEVDYFYIHTSSTQYMYGAISSFRGTVKYTDLTIDSITPTIANVGDEVTVKFGNWFGQKITLTLTANNRTIATFYVSNSGSGSDEPIIEEELIEDSGVYNSSEGTYTFTCGTDWFTKAGATGNEFDITVTAVEDGALQRTAKSSFKLKREGIGTEITKQPISTGNNSLLKLKFNKRNGHDLRLLIEGAAKGSSNRVKLVPSTSESYVTVSADTYTVTAADSWFNSINGSEMSVYITVTDAVDGRQDKLSAFTLKAGDALLPTISSITPYNISGNTLLDNYGYVVGYSRIEIRVKGSTYSGTSVQSIIAKVGSEQITCSYDSAKQAYVGKTSGTISSKSRITVTVTVTDSRGRVNTGYAYIEAQDITVLPNIGLTQQGTIYAEDSFYISPTGCIGNYRCIIKTANYEITTIQWRSEPTRVLTTYAAFFKNSGQAGLPSINLNITITDKLGRSANFTFVVLAPLPQILSFAYVHVPDDRMPESASVQPTKADVVSGYSKINFTAKVLWYCEPGSVVVKDQSNNANTLSLASNYSSTTFPKDADYSYTSDNVISTTYSQLIYTLTAKDTGVITSGMYRRTGEKLSSKITIPIYRLQNLTVTPPSTVDTDTQATIRVSNFVGSYSYTAKIGNDSVSESEEPISTPTFSIFADPAWFESSANPTLTVYVTVQDVLGTERAKTVQFTVRLNRFALTLSPTGDIQLNGDIQISVEGSGNQQVAIVLTTAKGGETLELASTTATTASPATVTCPRTWFTDHSEFDNVYQLPITVTASYAGRSTSQSFKLVYPALGLTLQKSDGSGDTATEAAVGDNVIYAFANQEGEDVNVHYYYSNFSTPIRSLGPYSASSATIATPQLFDDANANTVQTMKVSVVISDKRGRTAKVDNFTVKVNDDMRPITSNLRLSAINPNTIVKQELKNAFIENVSRMSISVTITPTTKSSIKNDSVYAEIFGYRKDEQGEDQKYVYGRYKMTSVGNNRYTLESDFTVPITWDFYLGEGVVRTGRVLVAIEAIDVRGLEIQSGWNTETSAEVYYYSLPKAKNIKYHRCNQDETPNDAGEYCHVAVDYQFTGFWNEQFPPDAYNEGRVEVTLDSETQYKDLPFVDWGAYPPSWEPPYPAIPDEGTVEFTFDDVSMERTYDITITLSDLITSTTYTVRLSTAGVIMDFLHDGKGLALGKVAEHQGMVEVNPEWTFQSEKMKVRVKDGTDDKGMYDIGQLLCQILNRMNNGGL